MSRILENITRKLRDSPVKEIAACIAIISTLTTVLILMYQHVDIQSANMPPVIGNLIPDKLSPARVGEIINWSARANDPENDKISYKFFINGKSVTEWCPQNFWIWTTTNANIGKNMIGVCIRDGKHATSDSYDDYRVINFTIEDSY